MNTKNDFQNTGRYCSRYYASNIVPTSIQFFPVNTPGKVDCIMN